MDAEKVVKYTPSLHVMNIEEKIGKHQKKERGSMPLDILLAAAKDTF